MTDTSNTDYAQLQALGAAQAQQREHPVLLYERNHIAEADARAQLHAFLDQALDHAQAQQLGLPERVTLCFETLTYHIDIAAETPSEV